MIPNSVMFKIMGPQVENEVPEEEVDQLLKKRNPDQVSPTSEVDMFGAKMGKVFNTMKMVNEFRDNLLMSLLGET